MCVCGEQTVGVPDIFNTILCLTHIQNNLRPAPRNPRPWLLRRFALGQTGRYIKHARPTSKHARETSKAETEWSEPSMSIYLSLYLSIYLFIYLCNIYVTIYLSILCMSNMLQTGQATPSSLTHVKQAGISNMPGRRQNMPGRRQS